MFIVFEGLDGSGSSTQANLLAQQLQTDQQAVLLTKEPTNNDIGKLIRYYLQGNNKISPLALQLLFSADRAEHLNSLILPSLQANKIVISDRYYFSSIAFGALELDFNWLNNLYQDFYKPDIVFLLKVEPEECIKRIEKRGLAKELFEQKNVLEKVWQNYEKLAKKYNFIHIIDGQLSIVDINQQIIQQINQYSS